MKLDARQIFPIAVSTVASSAALLLPVGRIFSISGTTNITSITSTNFTSGDEITLVFQGVLTFTNGNNLILFGNFVTAANYTITLFYNGSNWIECSRTSGPGTAALTTVDKKKTPEATISNNNDTGLSITNTPNNDGYIMCFVNGQLVSLGDGVTTNDSYFQPASIHSFSAVSGGNAFSFGLKPDGSVWSWGSNSSGQLGINSTTDKSSPVSVVGAHSFIAISAGTGGNFGFGLKTDGSVWAWGGNSTGQLGDNSTTSKSSPVSVVGAHSFVQIASGSTGGMGLKTDGTLWSWGTGNSGQLGDNSTTSKSSPVSVVGAHSFVQVTGGDNCFLALKANNGTIWSCGSNGNNQLGDNTAVNKSSPVSVVGAHSFITLVSGFSLTAAALKSDGSAWTWGSLAALGDNTLTSKSSPVSVVGGHSFVAITSGSQFMGALKANNGSVWAWGISSSGQLGNNTTTQVSSPVSVVGAHSFTNIDAGVNFLVGLKSDKILWNWGSSSTGQLGDRTTINKSSPVSVYSRYPTAAIKTFATITAGDEWWWNGVQAGLNLSATDKIDFNYI